MQQSTGSVWFTRTLITISPLSYREVLVFNLRNERPGAEVIVASPAELDGTVDRYHPHLVVCNTVTRKVHDRVPCWIEILVREKLDANVSVYGRTSTLENVETKDLLQIMDDVECQIAGAT